MIITETIDIKVNCKNSTFYKEKGYIPVNDYFIVIKMLWLSFAT